MLRGMNGIAAMPRLSRQTALSAVLLVGATACLLPGLALTSVIIGIHVLTTYAWGVLLSLLVDLLLWLPLVLGLALCLIVGLLLLAVRFPPVLPALLAMAGLGSFACHAAARDSWWRDGGAEGRVVILLGVLGTGLALWQFRRAQLTQT